MLILLVAVLQTLVACSVQLLAGLLGEGGALALCCALTLLLVAVVVSPSSGLPDKLLRHIERSSRMLLVLVVILAILNCLVLYRHLGVSKISRCSIQLRIYLGPPDRKEFPFRLKHKIGRLEEFFERTPIEKVPTDALFYLAKSAFLQNEPQRGLRYATALVAREEEWADARYLLADIQGRMNKYRDALSNLGKIGETHTGRFRSFLHLTSDLCRLNGQYRRAVQVAERMKKAFPQQPDVLCFVGYAYYAAALKASESTEERDRWMAQAEAAYKDAQGIEESNAESLFGLGLVAELRGKSDTGRAFLEKALALDGGEESGDLMLRARVLVKLKKIKEAYSILLELVGRDPTYRRYIPRDIELMEGLPEDMMRELRPR